MDLFKLSYVLPHHFHHNRYVHAFLTIFNNNIYELGNKPGQYVVETIYKSVFTFFLVIFFTTSGGCFSQAMET